MPTAIREQILATMFTALSDGFEAAYGTAASLMARNLRDDPDYDTQLPAVIFHDGDQTRDEAREMPNADPWRMRVEVEAHAEAASEATLGSTANALYAALVTCLVADRSVNGLALDVIETDMSIDLDRGNGTDEYLMVTVGFQVPYWTQSADPYTVGP